MIFVIDPAIFPCWARYEQLKKENVFFGCTLSCKLNKNIHIINKKINEK